MDDETPKTPADKPLYLMQGSPLVAGGKARMMSNRKVKPNRAKPREVTGPESIGYTTEPRKAVKGELECPSKAWLDATADRAFMLNQQARLADIAQAQSMRPALSMEHRMMDAQRRAKMQHVDCRAEFTAVKRMLDAAKLENDRRSARTVRAAEQRLVRIEVRLDQLPGDMAA